MVKVGPRLIAGSVMGGGEAPARAIRARRVRVRVAHLSQLDRRMPDDTINALEFLTSQHDEVDDLIGRIESAEGDDKEALFTMLADNLAAHAKIEEVLFYPAVMARQTEALLLESVEEHLVVKRVLADMLDLDVDDPRFDAKLTVLKEAVRHHARDEEEGELFPKVEQAFSADELDALGGELMSMFESIVLTSPSEKVPDETREAATLPAPM